MNKIIINADDFGHSENINESILELALKQRLHATSHMVFGEVSKTHIQQLSTLRNDANQAFQYIGLHIDFTSHLVPNRYLSMPLRQLILTTFFRSLSTISLRHSIQAQFDLFEKTWGHLPDFIDGHQHVHQFAQIRQIILEECRQRYPKGILPFIRSTKPFAQEKGLKAKIIYTLGGHALRKLAQQQGFEMNAGFGGVYAFQKTNAQQLKTLWGKWYAAAEKEGGLIMCHPARELDEHDEIGAARVMEFQLLNQ